MKNSQTSKTLIPLLLIGMILPAATLAEKGEGKGHKASPRQQEKRLEMFDADGDGALSKDERATAKAKMLVKHDTDGDGALSKEERNAAREARKTANRAEMLDKYDADGDGQLSKDEKAKLRDEMGPPPEKRQEMREKAKERFDTNGDGELSEAERDVARELMKKRKGDKKDRKGPPAE